MLSNDAPVFITIKFFYFFRIFTIFISKFVIMEKQKIFLEKAKLIHGDTYDYTKSNYVKNKEKITIICRKHGEFYQTPEKHILSKQGCPKCAKNTKITEKKFIELCNIKHNNKYDYSLVHYKNANSKIDIICPIHGFFSQRANSHMHGSSCPKCFGKNKEYDEIITNFKKIHGDKYDYSLVNYVTQKEPIKIICPEHGVFEQTYNTHKKGHGCPKCVGRYKTNNEFIIEANKIHSNKYDYSLVNYVNSIKNINIICDLHGEFKQKPANHLQGSGCPKCKGLKITEKKTKTIDEFINDANKIHDNKYDYSFVDYKNCKEHVKINCTKHGIFKQTPDSHLQGIGCPKCGLKFDKAENEIRNFLATLNIDFIEKDKEIIKPLELDILIPLHNIAIEFNGLYWHSDKFKPSNYHLNKTELCEKKNIKLIHIFEDEWLFKKDIVLSRLKNILKLTENKIYARKCETKLVDTKIAKDFLNKNHIQGEVNSSIKIGLYYNDTLVSLMTFGKGRIALGGSSNQYELLRFCNVLNTNVVGGADKLLQYFIKTYKPNEIISYADRRWSQGNLYEKLGFIQTHTSKPNYWYIINNNRKHRFGFRKSILIKNGYDKNKTEREIMIERKIYRIYDCGTIVYKKNLT